MTRLPARLLPVFGTPKITQRHVDEALKHIDDYWPKVERYNPEDKGTLVGLPYRYIVPSEGHDNFVFEEQYYWDSYFTAIGMVAAGRIDVAEGMLENLIVLLKRFGQIPNASRFYFTGRSQPPILTSYIWLIYENSKKNKTWLRTRMAYAQTEYWDVWRSAKHPVWHEVHQGLSRYYDVDVLHDLAEAESGWDMTTRFDRRALDFVPVDLNALLYKYEVDFARSSELLGDKAAAREWKLRAMRRKTNMMIYLWDKSKRFFFDYDFTNNKRGGTWSLAAFLPLWAGMLDDQMARQLINNLKRFEYPGGLATTNLPTFLPGKVPTQWAYPNGWAPLHYFVVEGLRRYGYLEDANRIVQKWLGANLVWYVKHGEFQEKYNVVKPTKKPAEGLYPSQKGFAWTNALFVYFYKEYGYIPSDE